MESLCDLLFEVSNEDRLRILLLLEKEPLTITGLSKALDLSTQETSRHTSRLCDVGLTLKEPDGNHVLTPFGGLMLRQLTGLEFVSRHRDYFMSHTLGNISPEYVSRLGELEGSQLMGHVMATLGNVEDAIREAEEYIWVITDQHISSSYKLERMAYERGVSIRLIEPEGWAPLPQHRDDIDPEYVEAVNKARTAGLLRERVLESLDFYIYVTDKQVAALAFPTLDGKFDYIGFQSSDPRAHKLCRELFGHYWERAKPRREFIIK